MNCICPKFYSLCAMFYSRMNLLYKRSISSFMKYISNHLTLSLLLIFCISVESSFSQDTSKDADILAARNFTQKAQYIAALPYLEKAASRYPKDADVQADLGIAIISNAVTLKDAAARKKEAARGLVVLKRAKELGTKNVYALSLLDSVVEGEDPAIDITGSNSKEVADLIRDGEAFFGKGDYENARLSYEKAFRLEPSNFEATLYVGDCYYAMGKHAEAIPWFERAIEIQPGREIAYRFLADALLFLKKDHEALIRISEAIIADPSSRMAWTRFAKISSDLGERTTSPFIYPPGKTEDTDSIKVDAAKLSTNDGTISWNEYDKVKQERQRSSGKGDMYKPTIADETAALTAVANAYAKLDADKKLTARSPELDELLKLKNLGVIDIYVLYVIHPDDEKFDYDALVRSDRQRLIKFFVDYLAEFKAKPELKRNTDKIAIHLPELLNYAG